jgi:hypothetical protein
MTAAFLAASVRYFVHKGKNGTTYKYFVESDFTPDVVERLNNEFRRGLVRADNR